MKKVFYAGNMLSKFGKNPTSVEILGKLMMERYEMILVSEYRNQGMRLLHMALSFIRRRKDIGIVLLDTYSGLGFYYSLLLAFLARMCSIPYVPILRGGNLEARLQKNPMLAAALFKRCYRLIAPSDFMAVVFHKYGYRNTLVIPNSINLRHYEHVDRTRFSPRLLWVRAFKELYRPDLALEVLSILITKSYDASLCMVGPDQDGRLEIYKAQAEKLGVRDQVTFPGKLSKAEWHDLSRNYDVFLNTSSIDNTPVTLVEAMALGLPIVSTDVGGIKYLLDNEIDGLLVNDLNAKELAIQVERLVLNAELGRSLALRARRKIEAYDWEVVKHKWFELIDDVV